MLSIQENASLLPYNTFKIHATARYFCILRSIDDLQQLITSTTFQTQEKLFLGGGSNILFTKNVDGLVIKNEIKGIDVVREDDLTISLRVGSGENWHEFVMHCVERGLGGIENLSLIPGTVGAAPMQNIGAYGVEVKNVIDEVEGFDVSTGAVRTFKNEECNFGYRDSIFKREAKDKYFISSVTLTLSKSNHQFNVSYGAIQDTLKQLGVQELSLKAVSDAVVHIRKSKLPDPEVIGNAGSFFKNPSIDTSEYDALRKKFPALPGFSEDHHKVKVPAAWFIEQCGWKGTTLDNIGVHPKQALVLVNYGGGNGQKIWDLAMQIQDSVRANFNITLHPEVNVI